MKRLFKQSLVAVQVPGRRLAAALVILALFAGLRDDVGAHAYLERSQPASNEVLASAPDAVRIWFTEPLEAIYTGAELFDVLGNPVETPEAVVDASDQHLLILPLPDGLEPGTYTVAWHNISTADGHPAEGFFAFTIGSEEDVEIPAAPAVTSFGGPPTIVEAAGRWFVLLGLMGALGMLVMAFWVLPGGTTVLAPLHRQRIWRVLRLAMQGGLVIALAGAVVLLIDQTLTVASSLSISTIGELLGDSSFGRHWMVRTLAIVLLFAALAFRPVLDDIPRWQRVVLTLLAVLPLVPISLSSHAAAIGSGDTAAVAADIAHLAAGSIWVGGLLALAVVIWMLRNAVAGQRVLALTTIIPRFSTLAIASVLVLVVSGLYASWLQIGNLTALVDTDYGRVLLLKLALMLVMLILGAVNLLVLEPRLRSGATIGEQFRKTVLVEALIGVALLATVGVLTSLPTARGAIDSSTVGIESRLSQDGRQANLVIAPGAVGANRYTVDVRGGGNLSDAATVLLRFSSVGGEFAGIQEIELQPTGDNRFEGTGTELSVVGDWDIEIILRQPGAADWRAATDISVDTQPVTGSAPGEAARFTGVAGVILVVLTLTGISLLVLGLRQPELRAVAAAGGLLLAVGIAGLLLTAGMPDEVEAEPAQHHHHHTSGTEGSAKILPIPYDDGGGVVGQRGED